MAQLDRLLEELHTIGDRNLRESVDAEEPEVTLNQAARILRTRWGTLERRVDAGQVEARVVQGPSRRRIWLSTADVERLLRAQFLPPGVAPTAGELAR